MKNRLERITNWHELAQQANWCAATLAKQCGVSLRTLERHFVGAMGRPPHCWLHVERMARAQELLVDGTGVKETAAMLGYKHATHFSRDFRKYYGHPPIERPLPMRDQGEMS